MFRWVSRLLIFALVPLVVVLQTKTAEAAVGAVSKFTIGGRAEVGEFATRIDCSSSAVLSVSSDNQLQVVGQSKCVASKPYEPDPKPEALSQHSMTLSFNGVDQDGGGCIITAFTAGDWTQGVTWSSPWSVRLCEPSEVCMEVSAYWDRYDVFGDVDLRMPTAFGDSTSDACVPISMDLPENEASCIYGTPLAIEQKPTLGQYSYNSNYHSRDTRLTITSVTPGPGRQGFHTAWYFHSKIADASGSRPVMGAAGIWRQGPTDTQFGSTWNGAGLWQTTFSGPGSGNSYWNQDSPAVSPLGVMVYVTEPGGGTPAAGLGKGIEGSTGYRITNEIGANGFGVNDPANCVFYFGPKLWDDPTTTKDTPQGTIGGPAGTPTPGNETPDLTPDPVATQPDPGCNFDLTDPTTWATAAACALVGLIKILIEKVSDLLAAVRGLVGALLDGLKDLFVPDDGFMDHAFGDIQAAWAGTSVMKYFDALEDLAPTGASSCGGIPLNVALPGGVTIDENLGDSCSGGMASAASMVRIALSVVLVVAGAFACVRAVGSGIGWQPTTGRGADG